VRRHILIDNSNLFIGAQAYGRTKETMDRTVRIHAGVVAQILIKDPAKVLHNSKLLVAGSKPPANNSIWTHWEEANFKVKVCSRDSDTGKEDLVDNFIVGEAYQLIADHYHDAPGENTLVLGFIFILIYIFL
jgi:hypothetical protein